MKSFLIVGNAISFTCESIFPLVKHGLFWAGVSPRSMDFIRPDGSIGTVNACWFTNLDHHRRHIELKLTRKYVEGDFKKYDTYDAIDVSKVKDIPYDYYGTIGVPVTYFYKHCPDQFEIVGKLNHNLPNSYDFGKSVIDGKGVYARVLIRRIAKR